MYQVTRGETRGCSSNAETGWSYTTTLEHQNIDMESITAKGGERWVILEEEPREDIFSINCRYWTTDKTGHREGSMAWVDFEKKF